MYTRLSSRVVFEHPRLTLIEDEIVLPGGGRGTYLKRRSLGGGVTILCRDDRGRLLVEREYSYVPDAWLHQFPGGGLGDGESPEAGANRELMEEVGLRANRLTLLGSCFSDHRKSDDLMHVYLGEDLEPAAGATRDEYEGMIETFWLTEAEIEGMIARGEIVNLPMLAAWAIYAARR